MTDCLVFGTTPDGKSQPPNIHNWAQNKAKTTIFLSLPNPNRFRITRQHHSHTTSRTSPFYTIEERKKGLALPVSTTLQRIIESFVLIRTDSISSIRKIDRRCFCSQKKHVSISICWYDLFSFFRIVPSTANTAPPSRFCWLMKTYLEKKNPGYGKGEFLLNGTR